jgi:hypothetical protein
MNSFNVKFPSDNNIKVRLATEQAMKTHRCSTDVTLFNLGARCWQEVNATPRTFYSLEREPLPMIQEVG